MNKKSQVKNANTNVKTNINSPCRGWILLTWLYPAPGRGIFGGKLC